jgi:Na+-driven multidrug efflux pump
MTAYKVLTRYFSSRGRQEIPALLAAVGLLANVGLNWLLIPPAGTSGAAVASLISYGGLALVTAAIFRREAGLTWRAALTPQPEDWLRLRRGLARWGALRRGET